MDAVPAPVRASRLLEQWRQRSAGAPCFRGAAAQTDDYLDEGWTGVDSIAMPELPVLLTELLDENQGHRDLLAAEQEHRQHLEQQLAAAQAARTFFPNAVGLGAIVCNT